MIDCRIQFHQHSTSSFYARRHQKRKKNCQVNQLFVLLGSASVKASHRMLVKLTPGRWKKVKNDSINRPTLQGLESAKQSSTFGSVGPAL